MLTHNAVRPLFNNDGLGWIDRIAGWRVEAVEHLSFVYEADEKRSWPVGVDVKCVLCLKFWVFNDIMLPLCFLVDSTNSTFLRDVEEKLLLVSRLAATLTFA